VMMKRQCACSIWFLTTRGDIVSCRECRRRVSARRGAENRFRRETEAPGSHTEAEWQNQIDRQLDLCFWCYTPLRDESGRWRGTREHLTPLSRGGSDSIDNIVAACWPCNRDKRARTEGEYRAYLECRAGGISEVYPLPTYMNLAVSTENPPPAQVLGEHLKPLFLALVRDKSMPAEIFAREAAPLVFLGIDPADRRPALRERRALLKKQTLELLQRRRA
jgi:5-methylcytosine-specific restriction endonuclease McrA